MLFFIPRGPKTMGVFCMINEKCGEKSDIFQADVEKVELTFLNPHKFLNSIFHFITAWREYGVLLEALHDDAEVPEQDYFDRETEVKSWKEKKLHFLYQIDVNSNGFCTRS